MRENMTGWMDASDATACLDLLRDCLHSISTGLMFIA